MALSGSVASPGPEARSRVHSADSEVSYASILERLQPHGSSSDRYKRNSKLLSYHHLPANGTEEQENMAAPEWRSCCNTTTSTDIPGIKELNRMVQIINMGKSIMRVHGVGFAGIASSFMICWMTGFLKTSLVDVSFFKSTGLLLAVMLSLRARNAVTRRTDLINQILSMINAAKTILDMVGASSPEKRRILSQTLGVSFAEVALWLTRHCVQEYAESISVAHSWLQDLLARLPDAYKRNFLRLGALNALGVSPRPQLLYLREVCDELFIPEATQGGEIDKISNIRRWHKNIDRELQRLIDLFDDLCLYDEEVHTKEFRWLISALIFFYVALYPWCVADERKIILFMTTGMMAAVFYGLDAMAQELEEPLGPHSQGLNVALTFRQAFAEIEKEEEVRTCFDQYLDEFDDEQLSVDLRAEFMGTQLRRQLQMHMGWSPTMPVDMV